jgi:hypothetical protein
MRYFIFLLCCLAFHQANAQNALADAIRLRQLADPGYAQNEQTVMKLAENNAESTRILRQYMPDSVRIIFDGFARNPFIGKREGKVKILFPQVFNISEDIKESAEEENAPVRRNRGRSGLSVNNIADGVARFLVNRTKEELSIAFFARFQRDVTNNPTFQTLLPATADVFNTIDKDIYRYNLFIQAFRQGFQRDLKSLPLHFQACVEKKQLVRSPKWQIALHDALSLSQLLLDKKSPDSVLLFLGHDAYLQTAADRIAAVGDGKQQRQLRNLAASLKTAAVMSQSLLSNKEGQTWLTGKEIATALRDSATLYLYLGLLWQKTNGQIQYQSAEKNTTFQEILGLIGQSAERKTALQQYLQGFSEAGDVLQNRLSALKQQPDVQKYDRYYEFFNLFFGLLDNALLFKTQFFPEADREMDGVFTSTLRQLNDLNFNVRQSNYSAAVTNLGAILTLLDPEDTETKRKVLKYGFFMASVCESDNSEDVAMAIEAVALPPGSSIIKKQTTWSAALNAYTGLAGGQERLIDAGLAPAPFGSVSAPIGLTVSKGLGDAGSLSLLVPIIDVGALVAFRFKDDQAQLLPKLSWNNIVAPGAYIAYGFFHNLPLTVGIGAQLGPALREVQVGSATPTLAGGWRWGGFISVDIPIFNLYSN